LISTTDDDSHAATIWDLLDAIAVRLGEQARRPGDLDLDIFLGQTLESSLLSGALSEDIRIVKRQAVTFTNPLPDRYVERVLFETGRFQRPSRRILGGVSYLRHAMSSTTPVAISMRREWPALRLENCVAQKLLRYATARSGGRVPTHWHDLLDLLFVAYKGPRLDLISTKRALRLESRTWRVPVPSVVPSPPLEWYDYWDNAMFVFDLPFGTLAESWESFQWFAKPILDVNASPLAIWDSDGWRWH
jgi:hypothetical protein